MKSLRGISDSQPVHSLKLRFETPLIAKTHSTGFAMAALCPSPTIENGRVAFADSGQELLLRPEVAERYLGVGKAVGATGDQQPTALSPDCARFFAGEFPLGKSPLIREFTLDEWLRSEYHLATMNWNRHKISIWITGVLLLVSLAADSSAADRLRVAYSALNASQSYLWVAQEMGLYRKYGLDVDLLYINSGSMNIAALLGGSIQIAGGGPVSIEARLRGIKLLILANPLPFLAANLVTSPDIKAVAEMKGKTGGISRFGSSTDQGFRYLFRKAGLSVESDLKLLQLGGDASRLAAMKVGKIQYTFLGAAATEQAKNLGYRVLATAQQMAIPFPWTSVVVDESWLVANRDIPYRYIKSLTESIWFMKHHAAESERIIGRYMKTTDPQLTRLEYQFVISLLPDYAVPTLEGIRLILENFGKEYPDAPRRDPKEFVDSSFIDRLRSERFAENLKL